MTIKTDSQAKERTSKFKKSHLDEVPKADRRLFAWIKPQILVLLAVVLVIPIIAAWIQYLGWGLPPNISYPNPILLPQSAPHGFPGWLRLTHFVNFIFLTLLIRSGLSILMDHPRLYTDRGCTPGREIIKFTPVEVPTDRMWTAKDDNRYISPWLALPGGRHTVGVARSWHFLSVLIFLINGFIFIALLLFTNQWQRLVPTSFDIVGRAWNVWVHYSTLHLPSEPNGFSVYNPLQQLAYFGVVFIMAPLSLLTGIAMSPAIDNRFPWYPKIFGGRQSARLEHFLLLVGYVVFIIIHVSLVIYTGFARNMNHIVFGVDVANLNGIYVGSIALVGVVMILIFAHLIAWIRPEIAQDLHRKIITPFLAVTLNPMQPSERYSEKDISPYLWPNGKIPISEEWLKLKDNQFRDYKLKISGLVDNPVELSMQELEQMMDEETISQHHCIQGWSGIAKWRGISMRKIIELVKPQDSSHVVAFFSFGEGPEGGQYYDTQQIENVLKPECLVALKMNDEDLPVAHGAPLRLRVENQLGYKMVKWIKEIRFIQSETELGYGFGGKNEDDEFFDLIPNI